MDGFVPISSMRLAMQLSSCASARSSCASCGVRPPLLLAGPGGLLPSTGGGGGWGVDADGNDRRSISRET
jgi:hypothetical protein